MLGLLNFPTVERPTVRAERPLTRDDVGAALLDDSPAAGYHPSLPVAGFTTASGYLPPLYQFERDIEAMVAHPSVAAPLGYYKAGLSAAEHDVQATSTDVQKFVLMTIRDFWERSLADAQISYEYARVGCEIVYTEPHGMMCYEAVFPFSPFDTTPHVGTESHQYAGFALRGVPDCMDPEGVFFWTASDEIPAKGFWFVHRPRFQPFWGRSQLWGAWRPWRRLAGRDGGEEITDAAVYRLGYRGPTVFYKPGGSKATRGVEEKDGSGFTSNRDRARTIAEQVKAGASSYFPSEFDDKGNRLWDMIWPEYAFNCAPLLDYLKALHDQVSLGIGVPPELLQASDTGSGYSGRQIPLEGYFMGQQENAQALTEAFVRQVVRPLVRWNFGPDADFKVRVLPILESRQKQAAAANPQPPKPELPGAAAGPTTGPVDPSRNGQPNGQPSPPDQRLATATADPLPESESVASTLATTARMELLDALRRAGAGDFMAVARGLLQQYANRFADALAGTRLAAMLLGAREVGDRVGGSVTTRTASPTTVARAAETSPSPGAPPPWSPTTAETGAAGEGVHLPLIEAAAKDLEERGLFTRPQFDALDAEARRQAFTVAGVESETVLGKIRDALHDSIAHGSGLDEFVQRVDEEVGPGTFLSDAHAENLFRTNVQQSYSHGMDAVLDHPMVQDLFPFEAVDPILDTRVRPWHRRLATGGLDGTNVYLASDPIYQQYLKPPSGWSCRCGRTPITVEQAAALGVQVARDNLERNVPLPRKQFDGIPTWWVIDPRWQRLATDAEPHKYSSTQFNLPEDIAVAIKTLAARIPDAELADGTFRESEPHLTVKYGIHTDDPNEVRIVVEPFGPVPVTLGPVSVFTGKDKDVVKIDVISPDLHRLNAAISDKLEVTDTHPEYTPHVTLAYVKPGEGRKYVGDRTLDGVSLLLDKVVFSNTADERTEIQLLGPVRLATDDKSISPFPQPETSHAASEGQKSEDDQSQHPDGSQSRTTTKAGSRDCIAQGGQEPQVGLSTDTHGAEHKAKGPGGGQFVPKGKGGTDAPESKGNSDRGSPPETSSTQADKSKSSAHAAKLKDIDDAGLNEWPKPGPKAKEILGDHPDTQSLHSTVNDEGRRIYSKERTAIHDKIIEETLAGAKPPADGVKRVLFMAGGTASGKSTALKASPDAAPEGAVTLDPDGVKEKLPEYQEMVKSKERYAANGVHEESSDIAKRIHAEAIRRGLPLVIDGTGDSKRGKFAEKFKQMHQAGYEVTALYVTVPTDDAIPRAIVRAEETGRFVPIPEIRNQHKHVSVNYPDVAALPFVKHLQVYDTSGGKPVLIASGKGGQVEVHDEERYQAFLDKANE